MIAGQATKLSRTMHDLRYDEVNDEFLVTNPFAQAVLVFRGGADGNEGPIRIIQGSKTHLGSVDRLVHGVELGLSRRLLVLSLCALHVLHAPWRSDLAARAPCRSAS